MRVWRVLDWAAPEHKRVRTTLVGRVGELRQFERVCRTCVESKTGQFLYVHGEAGIGKTGWSKNLEQIAPGGASACTKPLCSTSGSPAPATPLRSSASLREASFSATEPERIDSLRLALDRHWLQGNEEVYGPGPTRYAARPDAAMRLTTEWTMAHAVVADAR